MKSISDFFQHELTLKKGDASLHILNLGFEERCLSYPEFLSSNKKINDKYYCLSTTNEKLSDFLIDSKESNKNKIEAFFPSLEIYDITEILSRLSDLIPRFDKIFIDTSTLPRGYIFRVFKLLFEQTDFLTKKIYVIYSFPKSYVFDKLQQKAPAIESFYDNILLKFSENPFVIIIPGFDLEDTNIAMSYLLGKANQQKIEYKWFIPFPGRFYNFYERTIEANLSHIEGGKTILFPQEEINMAARNLMDEVLHVNKARTIVFVPIGSRINSVSVILAANALKKRGFNNIDIIIPSTKEYTSLRSSGYIESLIEEIHLPN